MTEESAYHAALRALKREHDTDLITLLADVREGIVDAKTLDIRKAGIANRYKNAARRLAVAYGKVGHDGQ